jgi:Uma2 family endonuclease
MAEAGVFTADDRVELIDGEVLEMSPIESKHAACVARLTSLFSHRVGGAAIVSVQNPVQFGEHSEPQPDLALLRPRPDFYASAHPTAEDVLLLIEVAESSMEYDRQVKVPLYARTGIPEMWLVGLARDQITEQRDPTTDGYRMIQVLGRGNAISPAAFPHLDIAVANILG